MTDALEDRMRAEAVCELADALDCLVASVAHDVRCAELLCERDPAGVPAEDDDPLRAKTAGGDYAAQPNRAVADNGHSLSWADPGGQSRVVACRHHVGEGEERRHQRVVFADRQNDERPVGLRNTHRLALPSVDAVPGPPAAVQARSLQSLLAEDAAAVRPRERCDDRVADRDGADVGADGLDDADELVAHALTGLAGLHLAVGPEVAAADAGAGDADEGVGRFDDAGVRHVLDADVAGAVHDSCAHRDLPRASSRLELIESE